MLTGKSITLLVTGSIAAYKSAVLIRELQQAGAEVRVAMSAAAAEFITPLTLQTLSGSPVTVSMFDESAEAKIGHIKLADEADAVLLAPATANSIAKAANGMADDIVSTVLLATRSPVVVAPAMNVNMWNHPATKANVELLGERGVSVMEPGVGELACGWQGAGRFPEVADIIEEVTIAITPKDLAGCDVLVTAGPTWESCDPIRFISNRSSGKMGYALAIQAKRRGANVCLISGPTGLAKPSGISVIEVETAEQMKHAVFSKLVEDNVPVNGVKNSRQLVFMAAAVGDHRPTDTSEVKIKNDKSKNYSLELEPCPDILQSLGSQRKELEQKSGREITLIGFAAETAADEEELLSLAREKLERKQVQFTVANFAATMGEETNHVWVVEEGGRQEEITTADKLDIAEKIIAAVVRGDRTDDSW